MKSRTITIAASLAALTVAAAPMTATAATKSHSRPVAELRLDRSSDAKGVRHTDSSPDKSKDRAEQSRDVRDL